MSSSTEQLLETRSSAPHQLAPWGHRPALDGLRTIAVYAVVAFHSGLGNFTAGFLGVDLFFVLSGYLVTNVLWSDYTAHGSFRLARFYARRARRLVPAALVAIVGGAVLMLLVASSVTRNDLVDDSRAASLWYANWHFITEATDYFDADLETTPYVHFWSLAIEEQFYLAFPLTLLGLTKLVRRLKAPWLLPATLAALATASLVAQFVLARTSGTSRAYYGTDTRVYQLLFGVLLALLMNHLRQNKTLVPEALRSRATPILMACAVGFGVLIVNIFDFSPGFNGLLAAIIVVVALGTLEIDQDGAPSKLLSSKTLGYLGRISYGTYLWHWPVIVSVAFIFRDLDATIVFWISALGGTALAALSAEVLELPIRHVKSPNLVTIALAIVFSIGAALLAQAILQSDRRPPLAVAVSAPAAAFSDAAPTDPGSTGAANDGAAGSASTNSASTNGVTAAAAAAPTIPNEVTPAADLLSLASTERVQERGRCDGEPVAECIIHEGGSPHIHLLGDSNARLLLPVLTELAQTHNFTFSASTQAGCPWQQGVSPGLPRFQAGCEVADSDTYERVLPELQPDVVLAINLGRLDPEVEDLGLIGATAAYQDLDTTELIEVATPASAERILESVGQLILIEPMPLPPGPPNECLAIQIDANNCAFTHGNPVIRTEEVYRDLAAANDRISTVDIDAVSCPRYPVCQLALDGSPVYRDQWHVWQGHYIAEQNTIWQAVQRELVGSEG